MQCIEKRTDCRNQTCLLGVNEKPESSGERNSQEPGNPSSQRVIKYRDRKVSQTTSGKTIQASRFISNPPPF